MGLAKKKKKRAPRKPPAVQRPKEFLDLIAPGTVQFHTDYYIFGNTYRTVMMLRGYPPPQRSWHCCGSWGKWRG